MNTYVDVRPMQPIKNFTQFVHWSERDGWAHLYLYDNEGNVIRQLTTGEYHVEKILGVRWSQLCGKHFFYSFDNPLPQDVIINRELQRMNNKFEAHPMFQGRKMAFAAYGIAYYNRNEEYIETPMLHDFSYGPTDPYCDMYGTFISYNPKTKQFEKYPRGWIKLKEDIDEYGYILSSSLSRDADRILSAYVNQKQKGR